MRDARRIKALTLSGQGNRVIDPFDSSQDLACWAVSVLAAARVDGIADWRMLERWAQVELYRVLRTGGARRRAYLGDYEQPYNTDQPISRQTPHTVNGQISCVLLFSLVVSGQIKLRRIDGWRKIAAVLSRQVAA